jgi:hypothetical protein
MTPPDGQHDRDFYAWTQEQAKALRAAAEARVNLPVDWELLAEEIEDLGKAERDAVRSQVVRVLEHLIKLEHSVAGAPRRGWRRSVIEARDVLADKLTATLRRDLEAALPELYARARRRAAEAFDEHGEGTGALPAECPYALGHVLADDWYPPSRHGLTP